MQNIKNVKFLKGVKSSVHNGYLLVFQEQTCSIVNYLYSLIKAILGNIPRKIKKQNEVNARNVFHQFPCMSSQRPINNHKHNFLKLIIIDCHNCYELSLISGSMYIRFMHVGKNTMNTDIYSSRAIIWLVSDF